MENTNKNTNVKIWLETASDLLEIQNKIKYLKAKQKMHANILKALSGEEGYEFDGYKYVPSVRKGSLRYAEIPELVGVDLDKYRNEDVTQWRLSFTKQFNI